MLFAAILWADPDPFAPWLQLIMQAGALGVLVIIALRVPAVILMLRSWRDEAEQAHREEREQIRKDNKEALQVVIDHNRNTQNAMIEHHRESQKAIIEHCDETNRRRDAFLSAMQKEIENLQEQRYDTRKTTTKRGAPPADPQT